MKRAPPSNPAAEADARAMLLAGGIEPQAGQSALAQVIAAIKRIDAAVLTIEEFCEFVGISRAHFYRIRTASLGPRLISIFGVTRIRKDDALAWLAEQPEVEQQVKAKPPPRQRAIVKPAKKKAAPRKTNVPRLFEPAPRKPGRRKMKEPAC